MYEYEAFDYTTSENNFECMDVFNIYVMVTILWNSFLVLN